MKKFLKTSKGKIILICFCAAVVITAVVLAVWLSRDKGFRSVVFAEVNGEVFVSNEKNKDVSAYSGMACFSGDCIDVRENSSAVIELDGDKHLLAEEKTKFSLELSGKAGSDRTVIVLEDGSVLTTLQNKLNEVQGYEVVTPISTVSVRGTTFRVSIGRDENGEMLVTHYCFGGAVLIAPIDENGNPTDDSVLVNEGEYVQVRSVSKPAEGGIGSSEYVRGENGNEVREIPYGELPEDIVRMLIRFIDDGSSLAEVKAFYEGLLCEHTYSDDWSYDEEKHWRDSICEHNELRADEGEHIFDEGSVTREPSAAEPGEIIYKCKVCAYAKTEAVLFTGSEITVPGYPYIYMRAGDSAASVLLSNPAGNPCCFVYSIVLKETGETLFVSNKISPGDVLTDVVLSKEFDKGEYPAIVQITTFALSDGSEMNGVNLETVLKVE